MQIHIHIHHHRQSDSEAVKLIKTIQHKLENMPTKAQLQEAVNDITSALDNISEDIVRLTNQLQTGGLNEQEEQEVLDQFLAVAARAKEIAGRTPETPTDGSGNDEDGDTSTQGPGTNNPDAPIGSPENPGVQA
jgi:hypothetical protein